ncbi:MAG: bifunctional 4-hydroxy-2-oxoglutarate aldolase/2-dehydro-3-deoxy-phosphogluconate aldolase [Candidatus Omnitrophica bacterium]|nr:bifunctional 4-hydroxy-2-oxoglutarate aldolase/2-dehydro-3-deoxy-phosphogluconate aldolase [Candidatus Omnitrophota bacterium]
MNVKRFKELPIMGILRDVEGVAIEPLTKSIISSGLKTVEITMNTPKAEKLICKMKKLAKGRLTIGAGTVLTMKDLRSALDAGAKFIVMPTLVEDVVRYCVKKSIPVFPGAMTPQEIYNAWNAGATMVKIFPAKFFGPSYIKEIKAPLKNIKLLACGGVTQDNIQLFFSCGASAVAFGSSVFKKEWLERREFYRIEEVLKELIAGFKKSKKSKV